MYSSNFAGIMICAIITFSYLSYLKNQCINTNVELVNVYNYFIGHSSLIGPLTGKIYDFDIRSKSCSICQHHLARKETFPQHVC